MQNIVGFYLSNFSELKWKRLWNRLLDTLEFGKEREDLLAIENKLFTHIKKEIEAETGLPWTGTEEENYTADLKVATTVYLSFKNYEAGLKRQGSFFAFKRK